MTQVVQVCHESLPTLLFSVFTVHPAAHVCLDATFLSLTHSLAPCTYIG